MQEFIPGVVDGQAEFYHVAPDGLTITHFWLTPGRYGPTISGPAADHPLGDPPHHPGWHDATGLPLPRDPREDPQQ